MPDLYSFTIMTNITYQELEKQFDEIMDRVSSGETFQIEYMGSYFALLPYATYKDAVDEYTTLHTSENNEAS